MGETVEIDLKELFRALLKKAWVITLCAVLVAGMVLIYTAGFVTPLYEANVMVYVNNKASNSSGSISSSELSVALHLVNTYVNIIKSDDVLDKVVDEVDINVSPAEIRQMLTAEVVEETEIFSITITNPDPVLAAQIANAVAKVAKTEIPAIIEGSSLKIVSEAKVPTQKASPSYVKSAIIGALVGVLLSAGTIVIQILLDVRVKSEEDLRKISEMPVLGLIPDLAVEVKNPGREYRLPDKQK